jgi:hypothetical protein
MATSSALALALMRRRRKSLLEVGESIAEGRKQKLLGVARLGRCTSQVLPNQWYIDALLYTLVRPRHVHLVPLIHMGELSRYMLNLPLSDFDAQSALP